MNSTYPRKKAAILGILAVMTVFLYFFESKLVFPFFFYVVFSLRHVVLARTKATLKIYGVGILIFCAVFFIAFRVSSCTVTRGAIIGIPAGVGAGLLFIALRYKDVVLFFDEMFFELQPETPLPVIVRSILGVAAAAVYQEIFFRGYLICAFAAYGVFSVLVSSLLFALDHFLTWRAGRAFTSKDYVYLFLLSCALGVNYYLTGSLAGCILGHLAFNSPRIIWFSLLYKYQKRTE